VQASYTDLGGTAERVSSVATQVVERGSNLIVDLAFEGVNGSTSFGENISVRGSPYLTTTQKYSGQSSAYFNGASSAIYLGTSAAYRISSDFVIDFYFKTDGLQNPWSVLMTFEFGYAQGGGEINNGTSDGGILDFYNGSSVFTQGGYRNDGQWHHIEAGQTGSTSFLKVDGVQTDSDPTTFQTHDFSSAAIGGYRSYMLANDNGFKGWIDDFKIKVFV